MVPQERRGVVVEAPVGHWKDGLFGCFNHGICSAHLWCALCFRQCALAQVMQRLGLNWLGQHIHENQARKTFCTILAFVTSCVVISSTLDSLRTNLVLEDQQVIIIVILQQVVAWSVFLWSIWAFAKTRAFIRAKYRIPENQCHGCEDLCCALWCSTCAVAQMSRHTGNYDTHPSVCCSETGMLEDV